MVCLASRVQQYKEDLHAACQYGPKDESRITGRVKFRGQGIVFDIVNPPLVQQQLDLRMAGVLAASFEPQKHLSYVLGRPVMAAQRKTLTTDFQVIHFNEFS